MSILTTNYMPGNWNGQSKPNIYVDTSICDVGPLLQSSDHFPTSNPDLESNFYQLPQAISISSFINAEHIFYFLQENPNISHDLRCKLENEMDYFEYWDGVYMGESFPFESELIYKIYALVRNIPVEIRDILLIEEGTIRSGFRLIDTCIGGGLRSMMPAIDNSSAQIRIVNIITTAVPKFKKKRCAHVRNFIASIVKEWYETSNPNCEPCIYHDDDPYDHINNYL